MIRSYKKNLTKLQKIMWLELESGQLDQLFPDTQIVFDRDRGKHVVVTKDSAIERQEK